MLKIKNIKKYIIEYECGCGIIGECMFKPPENDSIIVTDIKCPICGETERVKILRRSEDNNLEENEFELYWPVILENRIKG